MAENININELDPTTFEYQDYSIQDTSLISSIEQETQFDPSLDYIEYFIYDLNGNILSSNTSGYPNYTLLDNKISIDPVNDLKANGYIEGSYNTSYNFLSSKLGSNSFTKYYISEISSDRTELRITTTAIPDKEVVRLTNEFIAEINSVEGIYPDFYLNFDNNQLVIANNIQLDNNTVLIKLYDPLPPTFGLKSELWVVEKIAEPKAYNIDIFQTFNLENDNIQLQGPNLNISVKDNINNSTKYKTYSTLSSTTNPQGSGSLQYQLNNILAEKGIKLNVDYTDYNNFIQFSSAQTRLENFYYKLGLIEEYTVSASYSSIPSSGSYYVSSSNNIWQKKIDEIITGFDGYENYLYFQSGSKAWPKTNSTPPYTNSTTVSVAGQNFFTSQSATASLYDEGNDNALINTVPEYLREDSNNDKYELFIEMLGQQFDNIYLYIQSITDKFDADNRLNYGVSKDLVADIIRDLGVKIYQNNFSIDDLYLGLIGIDPSGSLLGLPGTTGSLPTLTGFEYIDTYVTASSTGSLYPTDDVNKSIYKRIYHNLPYLLKKKGTVEGLRTLINVYGIPDTILRINEFGGKDKDNSNDWDYWQEKYNYAFSNSGSSGHVDTVWELNSDWGSEDNHPETVLFRFKALPSSSFTTETTQSLWTLDHPIGSSDIARLVLEYDADFTSGSYSGSIANTGSQYATLKFYITNNSSSEITLPFIDDGWWSVMVTRDVNDFTLHAGNKIYNGDDGYQVGFYTSSAFTSGTTGRWQNSTSSYFPPTRPDEIPNNTTPFTGSYQEIRYYTEPLSEATFKDYIMNPSSIEGTNTTGSYNQLAFRAPLGGELYTGSVSVHPRISGSDPRDSFIPVSGSNFNIVGGNFVANRETFFYDQFPAGMRNRNSNKIKKSSVILPTSSSQNNIPNADVLSSFQTVQQNTYVGESYTKDIDYVEVAFSPQNEINDDIINQLGYFNIGEYIGDPRQISSSNTSYPDLDTLRDAYFKKYTHSYDIWDYVRLIKYLDNSLFKMLKDWVPARTSLASGVVIKQHLLERNKYPTPQLDTYTTTSFQGSGSGTITWNDPFVFQNLEVTGSSINVLNITGSNGGSMPELFGATSSAVLASGSITQSFTGTNPSISGSIPFTQSSQDEFFNGELSGSTLLVEDGELNPNNSVKYLDITSVEYQVTGSNAGSNATSGKIIWNSGNRLVSGIVEAYYVSVIWINETSFNNIEMQTALSNLSPGDEITLTVSYGEFTGFVTNYYTKTVTLSISDISGAGLGKWRIKLDDNTSPTLIETGFQFVYQASGTGIYSSVILNPLLNTPNFGYSDDNALINNATIDRSNTFLFDVDYSNSQVTALNKEVILSGNATKATVPDSNFTTKGIINSRYIGKELQASESNVWTEGDISFGKTVTVGNPQTYFAYFNWVGGTSPEWGNHLEDRTSANIKYYIDELGDVIDPINDSEGINLGISRQNFEENKNAIIALDSDDEFGVNLGALNASWPIFKSGYTISPILYTQIAEYDNNGDVTGFTSTGSIDFVQGDLSPVPAIDDYQLTTFANSLQSFSGGDSNQTINFQTPLILGESASFSGNTTYLPDTNPSASGVVLTTTVKIRAVALVGVTATYAIQDNSGNTLAQTQINHAQNTGGTIIFTDNNATTSTRYKLVMVNSSLNDNKDTVTEVFISTTTEFKVQQNPLPGTGNCTLFWTVNAGNRKIIAASSAAGGLNQFYGSKQKSISRSGFNPITLPFELQVGDEIRFEGTEELAFEIKDIDTSSGTLNLTLDRDIPANTDTDFFLIRRYIDDPSYVILEVDKPAGPSSGGILKPQYLSSRIESNLDTILENLQDKGLI